MTAVWRWRAAFGAYVLAQMVARLLIGTSLELDEAEAFLHGQHLAWGYGPQPPLYFWLQWAFLQAFGNTLLGVAALKALLLGTILIATFELMRRAASDTAAGAAALSLSLLPQVVWESQRALANSVLALALAVLATDLFLRALRTGRWSDHAAWGAAVGLGLLAKPNFGVWAMALMLAAGALKATRSRLRPARLALGGAVAIALCAGPAAWTVANLDVATGSLDKFAVAASVVLARVEGSVALLLAALSFNALGLIVLGGVLWAGRAPQVRPEAPGLVRLLALAAGLSLLLVWAGVLATGATAIKDRWLMPMAWPLVPAAVVAIWPAITAGARRALVGIAGATWLLGALLLPYASLVDPGYRGADWSGLAQALRDEGAPRLTVETPSTLVAGNLLFHRYGLSERYLARLDELSRGEVLLVIPEGSGIVSDPAVSSRVIRARAVTVPRGARVLDLLILRLAPA